MSQLASCSVEVISNEDYSPSLLTFSFHRELERRYRGGDVIIE